MTTRIYSSRFQQQINQCALESFKMPWVGSMVNTPENSNVIVLRVKLEMSTLSLKQLDKFLDCVIQVFPRDSIEKVDTNFIFLKTRTYLSIVIYTKSDNLKNLPKT